MSSTHARSIPREERFPRAYRVEQQRDHHRWLVGRPPVAVDAIGGIKTRQIQLTDGPQHRPDQVVLRHPVRYRPRDQKHLLAGTTDDLAPMPARLPTRPDDILPFPTASPQR